MKLPPLDTSAENLAYISALKPGEEVIEMGESCMTGKKGTVYLNKDGSVCVKWILPATSWRKDATWMGTSVTWGTRRISDIEAAKTIIP